MNIEERFSKLDQNKIEDSLRVAKIIFKQKGIDYKELEADIREMNE